MNTLLIKLQALSLVLLFSSTTQPMARVATMLTSKTVTALSLGTAVGAPFFVPINVKKNQEGAIKTNGRKTIAYSALSLLTLYPAGKIISQIPNTSKLIFGAWAGAVSASMQNRIITKNNNDEITASGHYVFEHLKKKSLQIQNIVQDKISALKNKQEPVETEQKLSEYKKEDSDTTSTTIDHEEDNIETSPKIVEAKQK